MRHRLAVSLLAASVATVQVAALARTLSPDRPISKPTTLTFTMKGVGAYFADVNPPGPSIGDQLTSHNVLLKHGKRAGHLNAHCVVAGLQGVCTAVLWARGGQIVLDGQLLVRTLSDGGTVHLAVAGGTGAFRHAGGQARIHVGGGSSASVLTIFLLP